MHVEQNRELSTMLNFGQNLPEICGCHAHIKIHWHNWHTKVSTEDERTGTEGFNIKVQHYSYFKVFANFLYRSGYWNSNRARRHIGIVTAQSVRAYYSMCASCQAEYWWLCSFYTTINIRCFAKLKWSWLRMFELVLWPTWRLNFRRKCLPESDLKS